MAFLNNYPESQVQVKVHVQPQANWHTLAALGGRVLVLPADHPWMGDEHLEHWIAKERVPVLVNWRTT